MPELGPETAFSADPSKALGELEEASALGIETTPVLIGRLTFLLRSAATIPGFSPLTLLDRLVDVYLELLEALSAAGARWVRLDEPALVEGRSRAELEALARAYRRLGAYAAEVVVSTSCSLLHVPVSLDAEPALDPEVRPWLAFAEEKVAELAVLAAAARRESFANASLLLSATERPVVATGIANIWARDPMAMAAG